MENAEVVGELELLARGGTGSHMRVELVGSRKRFVSFPCCLGKPPEDLADALRTAADELSPPGKAGRGKGKRSRSGKEPTGTEK